MEYLSFLVTRDSVKLINIKIESITNLDPTNSQKEVQKFIGVIKYYRNMCPRRSHMLVPLTKLPSIKRNFKMTEFEQNAFE